MWLKGEWVSLGVTKDKVRAVPAHLDSFGLILSGREATARVFFKAFKMTAAPLQTIPATAGKKARVTLRTQAGRVSPASRGSGQRALRNLALRCVTPSLGGSERPAGPPPDLELVCFLPFVTNILLLSLCSW